MNYLKFKFEKMKRYNFNIKVLMFFLLSFLTINKTYATHIIGGDITYRYISGNQYEITLTLRRDCALGQVGYDNPASLGIFSGANNTFIREVSVPFNAADTVGNTIDNACGIEGFGVCVQSATYKTIVDLPSIPGGYIIAYQRCCRNSSLNNVNVPLESGSTEWIAITEESMNLRNSSPKFILWPDVYICANKPLIFNHSATDIDGDSLVYKICTPFDGATIQFPQPQPPSAPPYNLVQFKNPYSLNDMMGGTPLNIDPISGTITANPNLVGQFLIGICVEEYRNGQLLSTVRRDFQYNVRVCLPPVVANFNPVNNDPCDSLSYAFTNTTENGTSFEWNFNFPSTDPKFISTAQNPTFKFLQSGTYKVRLLARSSTGACDSSIIREIVVRSGGSFPESAINKRLVEICSGTSFDIFTRPDASNQYIWTPTAGLDLSNPANPKFTGTQSTKYQVTITNSLGCSIIDSMEVRVTEKPLPLIISGNRNVCEDGNFSVSGGFNNFEWSKFADFKTIISSTSNLDLKLESLKTKIYVRSVNAVCGNIIDSLEVTRQLINISLPPLGQMCSNSSKSITVVNNNPDHTLTWTFNDPRVTANDNIITVKLSAPDTSSFNITGSVQNQFGCKQDVNIQVDIVVQKPLVLSGDTNVCGAADLNIAGGTNNFEWSNSADFNTIINSSSNLKLKLDSLKTKFFVRSTNPVCGNLVDSIEVINQSLNIVIPPLGQMCSNSSKSITVVNNNPDHTLTWAFNDPRVRANDNIITVKLSAPDTSSFNSTGSVQNQFGCKQDVNIQVDIVVQKPLVLSGDKNVCGEADLNIAGGTNNFEWSNSADFNTIINSSSNLKLKLDSLKTKFFVRSTNPVCGNLVDSIEVINQSLNIVIPPLGQMCSNSSKSITVVNNNPDHTLTWAFNDPRVTASGNEITVKLSPSDTSAFIIAGSVQNQFNCKQDVSIPVDIVVQKPLVLLGDKNVCGEANLNISGGTNNFEWSNSGDFNTILSSTSNLNLKLDALKTKIYVRSTNAICGNLIDSLEINNQSINITIPQDTRICKSGTKDITIINNNPDHNLIWTFNDSRVTVNGNIITIKLLSTDNAPFVLNGTVKNQFDCTQNVIIPINVVVPKTVTFSGQLQSCKDQTMCFSTSGSFEGNLVWNFGTGVASDTAVGNAPCFKFPNAGNYTVRLNNINTECPFDEIVNTITVPEIGDSIVNVSAKIDVCSGDKNVCFTLTGKYVGKLEWNFGDPGSGMANTSEAESPCHVYTTKGTYTVTLKNSGAVCPFKEVKETIQISDKFKIDPIADQVICEGTEITLSAKSNSTGVTYSWVDQTGKVIGTGESIKLKPMSNMEVLLKGINSSGCQDSVQTKISIFKFNYTVDLPAIICPKTDYQIKINITDPANYTFAWSPIELIVNGATTHQPLVRAQQGRTLTVVITDKVTGCKETKNISPNVNNPVVSNFSGNFCANVPSTLTLNISNPNDYTFTWSPLSAIVSGGTTNTPVVRVTQGQQIRVLVKNKTTGCEEELIYIGQLQPPLAVEFVEPNLEVKQGKSATISIKNPVTGSTYVWNTGGTGTSITVSPINNTTYTVTVTDVQGCTGTGQITARVIVIPCTDKEEYLPNAFTPNGDGKNDVLFVKSNVITEMEFVIYNRWGQEVFNTRRIEEGWDGTFEGKLMTPDVYAYYIRATCISGDRFLKKGNVSLLR